ncbi:sugar phosphate isomerase/epimerase [Alkalimonas delamerensis]|uniref:Sugar phosphate isomerase/epimerase n=1 Tax=Alkalimonas delamerensis TaxID=265981 RepID=A0ABT9GQQ2_9GAMM|nr:sugar phosphate isomerase/epimerase [Alkalimonas delamerensis]MDP4529305.1 sugar phosphate isomerase/epimerase [Alkalimonas delamerensis]
MTQETAPKSTTRRHFLKVLAGSGLIVSTTMLPGLALAGQRFRPGLQLFTVRELMQQDARSTLQLVANLGYKELEFAGLFGHPASIVANWLADLGLNAPAGHTLLQPLLDAPTKVLEEALTLGHRYVVLAYLHEPERANGIASYLHLAEQLNHIGEQFQAAGVQLAYHNHDFEFVPTDGTTPYEVLLRHTNANTLKMELDIYWAAKMQVDIPQLFQQDPGRFPLWHLKDMAADGGFADLGQGIIDFAPIAEKAALAGLQYAFVEKDYTDELERTLIQGMKGFTKMRFG